MDTNDVTLYVCDWTLCSSIYLLFSWFASKHNDAHSSFSWGRLPKVFFIAFLFWRSKVAHHQQCTEPPRWDHFLSRAGESVINAGSPTPASLAVFCIHGIVQKINFSHVDLLGCLQVWGKLIHKQCCCLIAVPVLLLPAGRDVGGCSKCFTNAST